MSVTKKIILNAASVAVLAGAAHAITFGPVTVSATSIGTGTYNLANEVAFTTSAPAGTITVPVLASTGTLPSGNILLDITLTNAVFSEQVGGAAVTKNTGTGTGACSSALSSVLSSGGNTSTGSVTFVLSGLNDCTIGQGVQAALPIRATGAGSVGVTAAFRTEASVPVDGGSLARSAPVVSLVSGFAPTVTADTNTTQLTLASGFKAFAGDTALGTAQVALSTATVYSNLGGTLIDSSNVASVTIAVTGDFTGYGTGTGNASVQIGAATAVISGSVASATFTGTAAQAIASSAVTIGVTAGTGTSAAILNSSDYSATMTVGYSTGSGFSTATESTSAALDSIRREGTTILLPWTSSATNAVSSGSTNIVRIGNRTSTAINGVFARVVNTSTSGFTNPGLVSLGSSIPANGELLITSATLEAALGNFARGDVEIVVEAPSASLSVRRLVSRPDGVFSFDAGAGVNNN